MPASVANCLVPMGVAKTAMVPVGSSFIEQGFIESPPTMLRGTTRDASGNALGGCTVKLFRTADDSLVAQTVSAADGTYSIPASGQFTHYLVFYLAGSPDVCGSSLNTLAGA